MGRPDAYNSVAVICSHLGEPLYRINPGKYQVFDSNPQVNDEPLDRYKAAIEHLVSML